MAISTNPVVLAQAHPASASALVRFRFVLYAALLLIVLLLIAGERRWNAPPVAPLTLKAAATARPPAPKPAPSPGAVPDDDRPLLLPDR